MSLLLSDFDFELPERLIARYPARPRDAARLLVVRPDGLEDRQVSELPAILRPGDLMVFNDTKVIPAQLEGRRARPGSPEVAMEVTLHKRAGDDRWLAFAKPGRRLAPGRPHPVRRGSGGRGPGEIAGRGHPAGLQPRRRPS